MRLEKPYRRRHLKKIPQKAERIKIAHKIRKEF
jgi:hypothetical protein